MCETQSALEKIVCAVNYEFLNATHHFACKGNPFYDLKFVLSIQFPVFDNALIAITILHDSNVSHHTMHVNLIISA